MATATYNSGAIGTGFYGADTSSTASYSNWDSGTSTTADYDWYINSDGSHYQGTAYTHNNVVYIEPEPEAEKERAMRLFEPEAEKERAMRLFESDFEEAEREEREERERAEEAEFHRQLAAQREERRRQLAANLEAKRQAEQKAEWLLETLIGPQIDVYRKTGRVFVKGNNGTSYIVRKGMSLQKIEPDKIVDLCVLLNPKYKCPQTDNVIALKTLLENDEDHVLNLANVLGSASLPEELPLAACM